jgi:DNA polymerase III subunit epsilon
MTSRSLQLDRPLIVFDLETTGLDPMTDRIVELGCVKLLPLTVGAAAGVPAGARGPAAGVPVAGGPQREIRTWRVNPGRPIVPAATAVHGISDADVARCPTFDALADEVHAYFQGCDLSGFHVEGFDLPLMTQEFERVGVSFPDWKPRVIDARTIFTLRESRGLAAALQFYCGREHIGAHGAEADAIASADVLLAQIERYGDLPLDVAALHAVCHPVSADALDTTGKIRWCEGEAVLGFGKHTGKPLRQLASEVPDYLRWILAKDFPQDTKQIVAEALAGRFPARV